MKTIFEVKFWKEGGGSLLGVMRKTIEDLPFIPAVGMEIEDGAWGETRKIVRVVFSINGLHCYTVFENFEFASEEEYKNQRENCFRPYGWESLGS